MGASFAGLTVLRALHGDFNIILIDKNDYFEYTCTVARALVKESYINRITLQYAEIIKKNKWKITFKQGLLSKVNSDSTIELVNKSMSELIKFDYLVICTGSFYNYPIKDIDSSTLEERKNKMIAETEKIKNA